MAVLLAAGLVGVPSGASAQTTGNRAAAEPIMKQLDAFKRDDYDAAYGFASAEIRQMFDRRAFERMVKTGYPEIARSSFALVGETEERADGHVLVKVKIRGANGNGIEALYEMVKEPDGWRINGVVTRPDAAGVI